MAKCCVRGCSNKLELGSKIRMFRFPALLDKPKSLVELSRQRRNAWLIALNRTNLTEDILKSIGICSDHFVTGSPARLKDNTEVDWIPTVKMGNQQRNRIEKKIIPPPSQTTKLKRVSSVEELSELEKLKNELKCKDAIIKNYKDESLQLKDQQKKIVNNYEERLKEKDVKLKMGIRDIQVQSKEIKEPQRSESHKKERGIAMRSGRTLHKGTFKHKLIKRCVVRVRNVLKVKQEPQDEEELAIQSSLTNKRSSSSKLNNSSEFVSKNRAAKDQVTKEGPASRNATPVSLRSKGFIQARLSDSPNLSSRKNEESVQQIKTASKKIDEYFSPKIISKKLNEPHPIKPISRRLEEPLSLKQNPKQKEKEESKGSLKKVEESVSKTVEENDSLKCDSESEFKSNSKKVEPAKTKTKTKKVEEPVPAMASTRTRRAPKPNPKYANDDIITPKLISRREKDVIVLNEAGIDSDAGDEFFYGGMGDTSETGTNDDASVAFEDNESSDFSEGENYLLKRKRIQKPVSYNPLAKRNRTQAKGTLLRAGPLPSAPVKSVEPKKPAPTQQHSNAVQTQTVSNRKRKIEEAPESIIARNKRLNIALYDANVARPSSPGRAMTQKQPVQTAQQKVQSTQATNTVPVRRPQPGPLSSKLSPSSVVKDKANSKSNSPLQRIKSPQQKGSPIDIFDPANTQDDFETMPTFTIVNINDIINKKGDALVPKRSDEDVQEVVSPNSMSRINRRKTGHTTILSEKIDPTKVMKPLPKTPLTSNKKPVLQSNTIQTKPQPRATVTPIERKEINKPKPLSAEKPSPTTEKKSPNIEKPAPRILNSVVAKRTHPVQPILSKFDIGLEHEQSENAAEKSVMVKENVGANKVIPTKPTQVRKLPPEKVCVKREGNKVIKKITCFDMWYVLNIPEPQEHVVKNSLEIPLITLGNAAKSIKLPSASWSYKVTLYKLSAQMMNKPNITPFTGDLSDQSIKDEDRNKYQPSCVMFRRMTQQKSQTRMPYDRAVIFKMKTFFTNIDGKNVRLIGAPNKISSLKDVEVLLELVDELDLLHEFVETASTV